MTDTPENAPARKALQEALRMVNLHQEGAAAFVTSLNAETFEAQFDAWNAWVIAWHEVEAAACKVEAAWAALDALTATRKEPTP